ncbi:hypothetical protein ACO0LG_09270 [Undibacterium sp. Ji42W]|uniref:hypothetical protein n=1 Tax=Undibacterium sp. Ji42W TaxID=3413039 RepID=UPI003BF00F78
MEISFTKYQALGNAYLVVDASAPGIGSDGLLFGHGYPDDADFGWCIINPDGSNVQFLRMLDRQNISLEIWERGAGYTRASGSSSCAAAAVAHRLGLVDANLTVHMRGGDITMAISPDFEVAMTVPVLVVCRGEVVRW